MGTSRLIRPRFERSVEVAALVEALRHAQPGDTVRFSEMTRAIGKDAREHGSAIRSARRILQREERVVFAAVPGVGVRRLEPGEIVQTGKDCLRRISRASIRGLDRVSCAPPEKLDAAGRFQQNLTESMLGCIAFVTRAKTQRQLAAHIAGTPERLPVPEILRTIAAGSA